MAALQTRTHNTKSVMTQADTTCTPSSELLGGMLDILACAHSTHPNVRRTPGQIRLQRVSVDVPKPPENGGEL